MYVSAITALTGRQLEIEFASGKGRLVTINEEGKRPITMMQTTTLDVENLRIGFAQRQLTVSDGRWKVVAISEVKMGVANATSCKTGR